MREKEQEQGEGRWEVRGRGEMRRREMRRRRTTEDGGGGRQRTPEEMNGGEEEAEKTNWGSRDGDELGGEQVGTEGKLPTTEEMETSWSRRMTTSGARATCCVPGAGADTEAM